jgi:Spermidine synthase
MGSPLIQATPLPWYSIALVSATALAYEILLMRLFSIIQWHHFAYMIISLALLGYGVSGTFLTLTQARQLAWFPAAYLVSLVLFGVSMVGGYLLAQRVPFNPEEILWDPRQPLRLLVIYLLLTVPFFFAANGIGLALSRYRAEVTRLYAADLLGAGLGSLGIVLLLFIAFPTTALKVLGSLGVAAAALAWLELRLRSPPWVLALLVLALFPLALPSGWTAPTLSPYKGLSQTLQVSGTRVIDQRFSPLGLLTVVESPAVPLRHAPGLSLNATVEPPAQLGVFTDGDAMTVITYHTHTPGKLTYLDELTSALPYHLRRLKTVLILGAGGGAEVLQAWYHGVARVDAVELNPQIVELVRKDYKAFAGALYDTEPVRVHIAEARGYVASHEERYDLIQLALLDSFSAASAGLYALSESYLYTVEALKSYLKRLSPGGYLAISRWIKLPPRDSLKLFGTAIEAVRRSGVHDLEKRLLLIRSWQTSTLVVKNGAFSHEEIESMRSFCEARAFDVAYYPAMPEAEANRYNILDRPYFYLGAKALLSEERESFLKDYKFNLRPATDDQPYFFHFFKWNALPEILALRGKGGMPLLEAGYLVLVATLLQALAASILLIVLPLLFYRRRRKSGSETGSHFRVLMYFLALGLAFLFLEIAFIQKFILFLHHPLYAVAVVLTAFLIFAGLGSAYSKRLERKKGGRAAVGWAVIVIATLGSAYVLLLGTLLAPLMPLPDGVKILIAVLLIAPLAFCMGMPFPLGIAQLGTHAPALIPWAWGINGCASVISAVLATLLAIHFGFSAVVMLALALYGIAALLFP